MDGTSPLDICAQVIDACNNVKNTAVDLVTFYFQKAFDRECTYFVKNQKTKFNEYAHGIQGDAVQWNHN